MFADTAQIEVRAGRGGDGRLSFRHEKYRAKGGPDGGDGGRGGDVLLQVDHNSSTLSAYRTARTIRAGDGASGGGDRKHGKSGHSETIPVPPGTQVWEGNELLADLTGEQQTVVVAHGGRGGFGNAHFTSSTRQTPRAAELGEPGEVRKLRLELKLVADVGLVGLPNAGKSTLLSVISAAKPEIADYPFTTLVPNLGMVDFEGGGFLAADIPGLIEGASAGKGLGDEFLRHIERTSVLLQLVDGTSEDVGGDWCQVDDELRNYDHSTGKELSNKPILTVLTKIDGLDQEQIKQKSKILSDLTGDKVIYSISAQAHRGLTQLLSATQQLVANARREREEAEAANELPVITTTDLPDFWRLEPDGDNAWRLTGTRLEGFARRTDFDSPDAVARLQDILRKTGVAKELRRQGAEPGDTIHIGGSELEWDG